MTAARSAQRLRDGLHERILSSSDVPFPVFAMFLGVAMSVTAFPVLARSGGSGPGLRGIPATTRIPVSTCHADAWPALTVECAAITASVVSMSEATDAAFWSATRTTLVGSMTPARIRSS